MPRLIAIRLIRALINMDTFPADQNRPLAGLIGDIAIVLVRSAPWGQNHVLTGSA